MQPRLRIDTHRSQLVQFPRIADNQVRIDIKPGPDSGIARRNPSQARPRQFLSREFTIPNQISRFPSRSVGRVHAEAFLATFTQKACNGRAINAAPNP